MRLYSLLSHGHASLLSRPTLPHPAHQHSSLYQPLLRVANFFFFCFRVLFLWLFVCFSFWSKLWYFKSNERRRCVREGGSIKLLKLLISTAKQRSICSIIAKSGEVHYYDNDYYCLWEYWPINNNRNILWGLCDLFLFIKSMHGNVGNTLKTIHDKNNKQCMTCTLSCTNVNEYMRESTAHLRCFGDEVRETRLTWFRHVHTWFISELKGFSFLYTELKVPDLWGWS